MSHSRWVAKLAAFAVSLSLATHSAADITINLEYGEFRDAIGNQLSTSSSLAVLVVDTGDNSFSSVVPGNLEAGNYIDGTDDLIIARFGTKSEYIEQFDSNPKGFIAEALNFNPYTAFPGKGLAAGQALAVYVFPDNAHTNPTVASGDPYCFYSESSGAPAELPAHGSFVTIWAYTPGIDDGSPSIQTGSLDAKYTVATPSYIATIAQPAGSGNFTGDGAFDSGTSTTVTAIPERGYEFVHWTEGGSIVSPNPSYTFDVTANRTLVAVFTAEATFETTTSSLSVDGFMAEWYALPGYSYQVFYSDTLEINDWHQLDSPQQVGASAMLLNYTDSTTAGSPRRFYKVVRTQVN